MIDKKLIHFNTYSAFEASKSLLYDWTIAFIKETKQIYTHGTFYDCDIENINDLQNSIETINALLEQLEGSKQDKINDLDTIRSGAELGTTALQSYTETDPVFSASAAAGIKSSDITNWNSKTSNTGTVTSVTLSAGIGISLDSPSAITTSGSRTISLASGVVTAGSAGPTFAVTGNYNTGVSIPRITVDEYGRVTRLSSYTFTTKGITGDGTVTKIVKVSSMPSSPEANTLYIVA